MTLPGSPKLPPDRRLTDEERYPLLSPAGRLALERIRKHPHAPKFNHACGDRLDTAGLARVRAFAERLRSQPPRWQPGCPPDWVEEFARAAVRRVPFHRGRGRWSGRFSDLPTTERADLAREPWAFVPDDEPLDALIVYDTSGTTGHRITLPSHPEVAAKYLPLLEAMLATRGLAFERGPERVAMLHVCAQKQTWTFGNIATYLDEAAFAKVNLDPGAWHHPEDRLRYLSDCAAQVYAGDPVAFQELARLPLSLRPQALISGATTLLPGVQRELESHFGCPVIEYYSMKESGPIAVRVDDGYRILPPDLYVEVLDPEGRVCAPGERGEVTLTGGRNPYVPLLRYRTGDYAAMRLDTGTPVLFDLEGRPPVVYRRTDGSTVNSIDVTWALRDLSLTQFTLHQGAAGGMTFRTRRGADAGAVLAALHGLFGPEQVIRLEEIPDEEALAGKVVQYTCDA